MIPLGVLASARVAAAGGGGTTGFLTHSTSSTGTTTRTFAGLTLGTAAADRNIVVVTHSRYRYPSGVTVAGATATLHASLQDSFAHTAVWTAAVPTGITGDVVVTYALGSPEAAAVALWAAYGALAYSASATTGTANSVTLTAPANCFEIAAITHLWEIDAAMDIDGTADYSDYLWYQTKVFGAHFAPAAGSHTVTASVERYANTSMVVVDFTLT